MTLQKYHNQTCIETLNVAKGVICVYKWLNQPQAWSVDRHTWFVKTTTWRLLENNELEVSCSETCQRRCKHPNYLWKHWHCTLDTPCKCVYSNIAINQELIRKPGASEGATIDRPFVYVVSAHGVRQERACRGTCCNGGKSTSHRDVPVYFSIFVKYPHVLNPDNYGPVLEHKQMWTSE